jgi:uncharacterized protein (DUF2147 family)
MPLLAFALAALAAPPPPASADIAGAWRVQDKQAVVTIAPCGEALCGKLTRFLVPLPPAKTHDTHNPDTARRGRPLIGVDVLSNLTRDGDEWHGAIYDPRSGKSYRAVVFRDGATLTVKGCLSIFCKTQTWDRPG